MSGRIEGKSTLPVDENGLPAQQIFEQIHTEDGRVYRVLEAEILDLPLLDDPDFKFFDDYEPPAPVLPAAHQQTSLFLGNALWTFMMSIAESLQSTAYTIAGKLKLGSYH